MSDEPSEQEIEDAIAALHAAIEEDPSAEGIVALMHALNFSWPEIQKAAEMQSRQNRDIQVEEDGREYFIEDGQKLYPFNPDSWWLDEFDRRDVIIALPGVVIMNTKPSHAIEVYYTILDAYNIRENEQCDDCFSEDDIRAHIDRFPEGQFMAMRISGPGAGVPMAMATTMRTSRPPTEPILPWLEAIGGLRLRNHESDGEWLYGVEMAVGHRYRRLGIGTGFYKARFHLARRLNLRGWYAVGMLMGYHRYAHIMDVREYGDRVIAREIRDPTVSMQLNRGFRPVRVVTDYCDEPAAGDAGVLIVWENPDYEA